MAKQTKRQNNKSPIARLMSQTALMLSSTDRQRLEELARAEEVSMSAMVRLLIRDRYREHTARPRTGA